MRTGALGSPFDFDQGPKGITSMYQGSSTGAYVVRGGETLTSIAQNMWGDASLSWKIAEANGLSGNAPLNAGQQLVIPAGVMRNTYNANTFTPYDPQAAMGNNAPGPVLPKPKKQSGWDFLAKILMVVIAVVVTMALQGATTQLFAGMLQGLGVPLGTATAVGEGASLIVAGSAGSIASQTFGIATGVQEKFSWNQVAEAGIASLVGGGASAPNNWGEAVMTAMAGNLVNQGVAMALGWQSKFSWAGLAAAGVGAGIAEGVASTGTMKAIAALHTRASWQYAGAMVARSTASAVANAATRTLIDHTDFGDNMLAALPDVIGGVIGTALGSRMLGEKPAAPAAPAAKPAQAEQPPPPEVAANTEAGNELKTAVQKVELEARARVAATSPEEAEKLLDLPKSGGSSAVWIKGYKSAEGTYAGNDPWWQVMLDRVYRAKENPEHVARWFVQKFEGSPELAAKGLEDLKSVPDYWRAQRTIDILMSDSSYANTAFFTKGLMDDYQARFAPGDELAGRHTAEFFAYAGTIALFAATAGLAEAAGGGYTVIRVVGAAAKPKPISIPPPPILFPGSSKPQPKPPKKPDPTPGPRPIPYPRPRPGPRDRDNDPLLCDDIGKWVIDNSSMSLEAFNYQGFITGAPGMEFAVLTRPLQMRPPVKLGWTLFWRTGHAPEASYARGDRREAAAG
ncbi:MAG TPA: LysM domain-containing protein [Hyphomonadaceae bacterium]|nr:LysM domain-containing protein [Hyphomonadaceae bacterium]